MESSESENAVQPPRRPPSALILINRPEGGIRRLCLEAEDLRLLKQVLNWAGYHTVLVDIDDDVDRISDAVVLYKPTLIFNLVEQMFGDVCHAPSVAGMLDLFGYVYTGSGPHALFDCQAWARTRALLEQAGLPLAGSTGAGTRRLHACLLGNQELEHMPVCESLMVEGELDVEACSLEPALGERITRAADQAWLALGLRDVAQIDFVVSPAGRVGISAVHAAVDLFGPVFRTSAASREGGMPGTIVRLSRLCHLRLPPDELLTHPLP